MKKIYLFFLSAIMLFAVSCSESYDDSALVGRVDNLENRVAKLEELCRQMNSNILSLQTIVSALQNNDYVTGITPIIEDGVEIGYTISFTKSRPIKIYHGKNGLNGEDGHTPVIGVKQDTDNIYYWTLDGDWILNNEGNKIRAQGLDGKNGEDGTDGKDGEDGTDGEDGEDGKDGITPQLKIENDYWYISYDNGKTWTKLSKAKGDDGQDGTDGTNGANGIDGEDGDSFFQNVDTTNDDYVIFTLADGTTIKIPTWYAFEQLQTLCNEMNTNIISLQAIVEAMQNNDYITSCTPFMENGVQIGYTITFAKRGSVVIYHGKKGDNGEDGETPIIGVKTDNDGIPYWTLNNEWLLDAQGNRVQVRTKDGITPKFKIENEYWYISYDNEASWAQLGRAKGDNGDSLFKSITQDEDNVYLEMANGNIITIAKNYNLSITFNPNDLGQTLIPGNTYNIGYTVETGTTSVDIELVPSGNITARVIADNDSKLTGSIEIVTGQTADAETNLIVFVYNGNKVVMKSLEFDTAGIKSYDNPTSDVPQSGGYVKLEFLSNVESVPVIPASAQSWISVAPDVRSAMEYGSVLLSVSPNDNSTPRSATVRIESKDGSFGIDYMINQAGGHAYSEIWYTTNTGKEVQLKSTDGFGSAFLTNKYSNGKGVIKFESAITLVGISAFEGCNTLTSIVLPESVTSIGSSAFKNCTALTQIEIPESVTSIGESAFSGCTALTSIEIPDAVNSIGASAFSGCSSIRNFEMPDAVTQLAASTFASCKSLANVTLSKNIISIGSGAFSQCYSLRNITIPNGLTTIGSEAFSNCTGLTSITIPDSVITIEMEAFYNCSLLTSISFGKNITSIGWGAFCYCDGITSVNIPDSVISIGYLAFYDCDGLRRVTIGKNVATIGRSAFYACDNMTEVYIKSTTPAVLYGGYPVYGDYTRYNNSFNSVDYPYNFDLKQGGVNCTIYVPLYSINDYKRDWEKYSSYIEGYEFE